MGLGFRVQGLGFRVGLDVNVVGFGGDKVTGL